MQFNWLNKQNNETIILFFNGWGMDAGCVTALACTGFDLLEIHDYSTIASLPELSAYKQTILVAWSLGVFVAAQCRIPADLAIAINGTLRPLDEHYGIQPAIFQGTINSWDERGRNKFNRRMCGDRDTLAHFNAVPPCRSIEATQQELMIIAASVQVNPVPDNVFDKAIVGLKDRIMPSPAQMAFWQQTTTDIINVNGPHYLFNRWSSWKDLIDFVSHR